VPHVYLERLNKVHLLPSVYFHPRFSARIIHTSDGICVFCTFARSVHSLIILCLLSARRIQSLWSKFCIRNIIHIRVFIRLCVCKCFLHLSPFRFLNDVCCFINWANIYFILMEIVLNDGLNQNLSVLLIFVLLVLWSFFFICPLGAFITVPSVSVVFSDWQEIIFVVILDLDTSNWQKCTLVKWIFPCQNVIWFHSNSTRVLLSTLPLYGFLSKSIFVACFLGTLPILWGCFWSDWFVHV